MNLESPQTALPSGIATLLSKGREPDPYPSTVPSSLSGTTSTFFSSR